jgi:Protein of unknown function (DUF2605)
MTYITTSLLNAMPPSHPSEQDLLKTILQPLLEDFSYWFARSISLLESEQITFLSESEQNELLAKVKNAAQEVSVAQMLFNATDGQVGIEPSTMLTWHRIVGECWRVATLFRQLQSAKTNQD